MLKKFLRKLRSKFLPPPPPIKTHPDYMSWTDEEIIQWKSRSWLGEENAKNYSIEVDKVFFSRITLKLFLRYINACDKVLDIGAGTGRLTMPIADMGCSVTALDISQEMLDVLDRNKGSRDIEIICSNANSMPFSDNTFDAIVHLSFLVHFPNWRDLLVEQLRVCKSGGVIIFNMINADNLKNYNGGRKAGIAYLSKGLYYASATRNELEAFALANDAEIVAIHPNRLFMNSYDESVLSFEELYKFNLLLSKACHDERIMSVMEKMELEIIQMMPEDITPMAIIAMRKKTA